MFYLGFFRLQLGVMVPGSKIKRSQLSLAPPFQKLLNIKYSRSSSICNWVTFVCLFVFVLILLLLLLLLFCFLFWLAQKEKFLKPMEKNPYIVNCWCAGVSNYNIILVITKIYIFLLLYFALVLLLIMRSQPASIAWTITSTTAFYHKWSYTEENWFIN